MKETETEKENKKKKISINRLFYLYFFQKIWYEA